MKIVTNFTKKTAAEFPDAKDIFRVWAGLYDGSALEFEKNFRYNNLVRDYRMHINDGNGPYVRQLVEAGRLVQAIDSSKGHVDIERVAYNFMTGDLFSIEVSTHKIPGADWAHATVNIDHKPGKAKKRLIEKLYSEPMASPNVLMGAAFDDIIMHAVKHHADAIYDMQIKVMLDKGRLSREFYIAKDHRKNGRNISVNGSPFSYDYAFSDSAFVPQADVGYGGKDRVRVSRRGRDYIAEFPEIRARMDLAKSADESFRIGALECINNHILKNLQR